MLGTDGFFERRCEDVRRARRAGHPGYFEKALEAEKYASTIEEWCPTLIPGLLQTPAYARAVIPAGLPLSADADADADADAEVEEKANARMARPDLFEADHRTPEYWVILRRRITPQIVPRKQKAYPLMAASIMTMTFPDAPPLVYTEASYSGDTVDDPALVERYRKAYDRLRAVVLSPDTSLAMIKAAAEDYRSGKQRDRLE